MFLSHLFSVMFELVLTNTVRQIGPWGKKRIAWKGSESSKQSKQHPDFENLKRSPTSSCKSAARKRLKQHIKYQGIRLDRLQRAQVSD